MKKMSVFSFLLCVVSLSLFAFGNADTGKGMSLAILVPEGKGLGQNENYLPTLIQGVFVGDVSKYTNISVLDRQGLEKVLKETESGLYKNEAEFLQLGKIANVGYAMTGSLTKTNSGFALSITITDTKTGITQAAYNGSCTLAELENFTGIKRASQDLLTQLGIKLTAKAKEELSGASATPQVNAEIALSKGITAQKSGKRIESLAYYYEASGYDSSLKEASSRLNTLSSSVRSGNLVENIRNEIAWRNNDIAWRNEWIALINEARAYVISRPVVLAELVYDPRLRVGHVDYNSGNVVVSFKYRFEPIRNQPLLEVLKDVQRGLDATGRKKAWGLGAVINEEVMEHFSGGSARWSMGDDIYSFSAQLLNDRGVIISSSSSSSRRVSHPTNSNYDNFYDWKFGLRSVKDGIVLYERGGNEVSFTVDPNNITENMSIKITDSGSTPVMTSEEYRKEWHLPEPEPFRFGGGVGFSFGGMSVEQTKEDEGTTTENYIFSGGGLFLDMTYIEATIGGGALISSDNFTGGVLFSVLGKYPISLNDYKYISFFPAAGIMYFNNDLFFQGGIGMEFFRIFRIQALYNHPITHNGGESWMEQMNNSVREKYKVNYKPVGGGFMINFGLGYRF
jgi:hypothetical protein